MHLTPIIFLLLTILTLLSSCKRVIEAIDDFTEPAFGVYQDSIDTLRMRQHLSAIIAADSSGWNADLFVRHRYDTIASFGDIPLWFNLDDGLSPDADELLDYLRTELPQSALDTTAFLIPQIAADLNIIHHLAFDSLGQDINEVLPRLDYNLSKAYVKYVTGTRYGFTRPARLYNRLYYREDSTYAHLYDYATPSPNYQESLDALSSSERITHLKSSFPANAQTFEALRQALTSASTTEERHRIAVNMERCRWRIPHPDLSQRMVVVNLPSQQLWAVGGDTILNMKVCYGALKTKTPLLSSHINCMQVNPEWSLPPKIVASDFPRHAGDSAWFARHKYFVIDRRSGDTLNINHLSADDMRNRQLRFVQRGGQGNSLGRIVFRFANSFSVYLHDTNSPGAFHRDRRAISHGCVRVERPFDLALFLLPDLDEWSIDRLRISMDLSPLTYRGMEWLSNHADSPRPYRLFTYHKVSPPVPVHLIYYTMYPNPETGIMETHPDIYGYDQPLLRQLQRLLE